MARPSYQTKWIFGRGRKPPPGRTKNLAGGQKLEFAVQGPHSINVNPLAGQIEVELSKRDTQRGWCPFEFDDKMGHLTHDEVRAPAQGIRIIGLKLLMALFAGLSSLQGSTSSSATERIKIMARSISPRNDVSLFLFLGPSICAAVDHIY